MSGPEALFYLANAVLLLVPPWFIKNRVYNDGVVGRLALSGIVICAFAILGQAAISYFDAWMACPEWPAFKASSYKSAGYSVVWEEAWLAVAFAGFMLWHLIRFHRRVLRGHLNEAR